MSRAKILNFILNRMNTYVVERMIRITEDYSEDKRFVSEEEFKEHQEKYIDLVSDKDILLLKLLMNSIMRNKIKNADEEGWVAFETDGFFYDKQGKLVIMNYR